MTNAKTHKQYDGGNVTMLEAVAQQRGYEFSEWATFLQWRDMGYSVRKGERGTKLARYGKMQTIDKKTGEAKQSGYRKAFTVFNVAQVERVA